LNIAQTAIGFIICRIQDHPLWPQDFARISQSAEAAIDIRQLAGTNGGFPAGTGGAAAAFAGCYATRFIYGSVGRPCGAVVPYGDRGSYVSVHYPLAQRAQGMLAPNSPFMA
jgi:hypothetical protein